MINRDELNKLVCKNEGWRHVYTEKLVKVEAGEIVQTEIVSAYIDSVSIKCNFIGLNHFDGIVSSVTFTVNQGVVGSSPTSGA